MRQGNGLLPVEHWNAADEGAVQQLFSGGDDVPSLAVVERTYLSGEFERASALAAMLAKTSSEAVRMAALTLKVGADIGAANEEALLQSYQEAVCACKKGLRAAHARERCLSTVCARVLEDATSIPIVSDDAAEWYVPLADMPAELRAYCGFQMAYRVYVQGKGQQAIGMAEGFRALMGAEHPVADIKSRLLEASAYLQMRDITRAVENYLRAWETARPWGIVAPFVEMSPTLPGLVRHCVLPKDEKAYTELRAMIGKYHDGWHMLRLKCGKPVAGGDLSVLEYSTGTLAAWGWTNREVAGFLGISENTVKHYLASAYRKLGVKNRSELATGVFGNRS